MFLEPGELFSEFLEYPWSWIEVVWLVRCQDRTAMGLNQDNAQNSWSEQCRGLILVMSQIFSRRRGSCEKNEAERATRRLEQIRGSWCDWCLNIVRGSDFPQVVTLPLEGSQKWLYHPMMKVRSHWRVPSLTGLVRMSAGWSNVRMEWMEISLESM